MTSVSIRSPTIAVVSECASIAFSAERIISGFGLPTKYGVDAGRTADQRGDGAGRRQRAVRRRARSRPGWSR